MIFLQYFIKLMIICDFHSGIQGNYNKNVLCFLDTCIFVSSNILYCRKCSFLQENEETPPKKYVIL